METTHLPEHLLMPFFNQKAIYYKKGNNPEQPGWLGLTVFGDGSVSLQLYSVSKAHVAFRTDGQTLTNDMLGKVFWDEGRKAFVAKFE
jgi:hypothetical protein